MLVRFVGCGIAMLMLLLAPTPLRASPELDLNTRFIQGSFDILLPDGWIAALSESGHWLIAESPDRHHISIGVDFEGGGSALRAHHHYLKRMGGPEMVEIEVESDSASADKRRRITVVKPVVSFIDPSPTGADVRHILVFDEGDSDQPEFGAVMTVAATESEMDSWTEFFVVILDSLWVSAKQTRGGPLYKRVKHALPIKAAQAKNLIGSWRTRNIVGTATFEDSSPTDNTLADAGFETLTFAADGHYKSAWKAVFMALEDGELISRDGEHRETGRWRLDDGTLILSPEEAEGRTSEDRKNPSDLLPMPTPMRRYQVILRDGTPVLRGVCPAFAEMVYCEDLYSGGRRIVDFILEPVAAK